MKLNEKIQYCRKKAGLSQLDLADELGVSRQAVSKWETGESNPDVSKIPLMAKTFGVTADWLLSEEDPKEAEAPAAGERETIIGKPYPDWVEHLPRQISNLIKRFGWIFGVRIALGGVLMTAMGCLARFLFRSTIFGATQPTFGFNEITGEFYNDVDHILAGSDLAFGSPYDGFHSTAWSTASAFTAFVIGLGIVITLAGIVLAVLLRKWGKNTTA